MKVYEPPMNDLMAALLDFARLSQLASSTTVHESDLVAILLLERLLRLCDAQKGAILLITQPPIASRKIVRSLALSSMSDEDTIPLTTSFSFDGADFQIPSEESCWLLCKLPTTIPFVSKQHKEAIPYTIEHPADTPSAFSTLVVLGWNEADTDACAALVTQGRGIMSHVANTFSAAILNVMQAEHIHELEMAAEHKALHEMDLFKAELLATVSHELRSPLASIKGYTATLLRHERRISREERHEFLLAINEASDRLEIVINRLLEVSQLETGTITIECVPINLALLIQEAILAVEEHLQEIQNRYGVNAKIADGPHFTFTLRVEDEQGQLTSEKPILYADRIRLREVFDNLLENAINYSPEGGEIEVIIGNVASPNQTLWQEPVNAANQTPVHQQMLEIVIRDRGIGIPPEQLKTIFKRFHRVDTRLTREVNGLGLGLAICKHIIELHDGMVWAESDFGKGSTFHIRLPVENRFIASRDVSTLTV